MGKKSKFLTLISLAALILILIWANHNLDVYILRVLNLCAINIVLALGLNLILGFTGQFSLGSAGFMAVGAYVAALLTMSPESKAFNFFMEPIIAPLANIQWPFIPALIAAGLVSALVGLMIGAPVLRLRGDYLAIATLGFAEIIRVIFTNTQNITNGALGLKGIPQYTNLYWSWGIALASIILTVSFINSSYGRAFKAIREDEIAAEAMGINLFKHKVLAFTISAFLTGIGGALLGNLLTTVNPSMFQFFQTFQILLIVVLGGLGSITGTIISAIIVTVIMEVLRFVEAPIHLGFINLPGIPGMRMVVFSVLLMVVILFFQQGLMGTKEFSWEWFAKGKRNLNKMHVEKDV